MNSSKIPFTEMKLNSRGIRWNRKPLKGTG